MQGKHIMSNTQNNSVYEPAHFVTPYWISRLPGITMPIFKMYQVIYEFLNRGKECFLSNRAIMDRAEIKSISTVIDGFAFLEKHRALKRVQKGNRRFIVIPNSVEIVEDEDNETAIPTTQEPVDNSKPVDNFGAKSGQGIATAIGGYRNGDRGGIATAIHNNNNLNNNNLIKDKETTFDKKETKQNNQPPETKPKPFERPEKKPSSYVERNTMSDEYRNVERSAVAKAEDFLSNLPSFLKPKRYKGGTDTPCHA